MRVSELVQTNTNIQEGARYIIMMGQGQLEKETEVYAWGYELEKEVLVGML